MADLFSNALSYERAMGRWSARLAPLFVTFAQVTDGGRVVLRQNPVRQPSD